MIGEYHLKLEAQTLIKNRNSWHHFLVLFLGWGTRMAQWWEHSPPNNVARVQIPASTPYVGGEFVVGSLPCFERFSLNTPAFPCPQKPTFSNSNSTRNRIDKEPLCGCATSKSLYIFIYYYTYLLLNWSRLDFHRSVGHPREETVRGRSAGSFNEQRLIIEPTSDLLSKPYYELYSQISDYWVM